MTPRIHLLITLYNEAARHLSKFAVTLDRSRLKPDTLEYPLEPEGQDDLKQFLPHEVVAESIGPVVAVEIIDGVEVKA